MVVFVYGAQLLFEPCDCAVPVRARYREGEDPPVLHFQGLLMVISCLWSVPCGGKCPLFSQGDVPRCSD